MHSSTKKIVDKIDTDKKIEEVFKRLDQGEAVPKEMVFFKGEFFAARVIFEKIVKTAAISMVLNRWKNMNRIEPMGNKTFRKLSKGTKVESRK